MSVDAGRGTIEDEDASAIGLPSRNAGCEVLIGISNAPVVLRSEGVWWSARRVAPQPERFDEVVAFLIVH